MVAGQPTRVYLMRDGSSGYYKVGVSTDVDRRLEDFRAGNPDIHVVAMTVPTVRAIALQAEAAVHEYYSNANVTGEWFALPPEVAGELTEILEGLGE